MQYRAFISHSHADAKFAAWLQRAIESWRVPSRLGVELGYSRVRPVFRDRTDLRAATNLGEALEGVLQKSSVLIVVCSNEAADSEWVDQDIARYQQFNPDSPILAIIASGEPPHCFPKSLLIDAAGNALEPLAADARKGFDGKRDALLKTIAGIIDVDFDVLKQREFRRRQQRMGAIAALSASVAVVTLYLAYAAYEARDDANRRREQADDLLAFMLGDLRERLEPIGKLDVLDAVGDKALDYFSQLEGADITPEVTLKQALAIRQIGEVQMARGNHEAAVEAFERSLSTLKAIRAKHPSTPRVSFEIAQSEFWIGNVYYEQSEVSQAREGFQRYLDESRALLRSNKQSVEYKQEVVYATTNLGALEIDAGNYKTAKALVLESLEAFESYSDELGNFEELDQRQLFYSWLGEIAFRSGNLAEARSWYSRELEAVLQITSQSSDKYFEEVLSHAARRLTVVELLLGDKDASLKSAEMAVDVSRDLVLFDGENFYWLNAHSMAGISFSEVLLATKQPERALEIVREILPLAHQLIEREPEHLEALRTYLHASSQLARVLNLLDQQHEALKVLDSATSLSSDHSVLNERGSEVFEFAELQLVRGDTLMARGEPEAALESWHSGLGIFHAVQSDNISPRNLVLLFTLLSRVGDRDQALTVQEQLFAMGVSSLPDSSLPYFLSHVPL